MRCNHVIKDTNEELEENFAGNIHPHHCFVLGSGTDRCAGSGAYNDIILIPTDDALLIVGADSNYGTITCVAIM